MNIWIQKHDFSSDDLGSLSAAECVEILNTFDWNTEIQMGEQRIKDGVEACDPGMGLVTEDETIFHILPSADGSLIHHHWNQKPKVLGFFRTSRMVNTSGVCTIPELIEKMIYSHFSSAHECTRELILEATERSKSKSEPADVGKPDPTAS